MATTYTGIWNMKDIYRGDTINPLGITIRDSGTQEVVIPKSVCLQFRDKNGRLIYSWLPTITASGRVLFPLIETEFTSKFPLGTLRFDIEFTRMDDKVRTYVSGTLNVLEDISRC